MSVERVRNYLQQFGADGRIIEFELSSATVDLAAKAAGVDAAGLLGRAGLHCPVRWSALEGQWAEKFPGLSIDLRVEAALETET